MPPVAALLRAIGILLIALLAPRRMLARARLAAGWPPRVAAPDT